MKTKILLIKSKSEEELKDKINQSKVEFFATQPIEKRDGSWVAFCYYKSDKEEHIKEELATEKQIKFLAQRDLDGLNFETLTKKEAFKLISEIKGKEKK